MDRLILANYRANQLAGFIAARLEVLSADEQSDDVSSLRDELDVLGLIAIQIRQFLAESTWQAGAYLDADPEPLPLSLADVCARMNAVDPRH